MQWVLVGSYLEHDQEAKKAAPQGGLLNQRTPYGMTPAGGCGTGPAVVAAAASFKIR